MMKNLSQYRETGLLSVFALSQWRECVTKGIFALSRERESSAKGILPLSRRCESIAKGLEPVSQNRETIILLKILGVKLCELHAPDILIGKLHLSLYGDGRFRGLCGYTLR